MRLSVLRLAPVVGVVPLANTYQLGSTVLFRWSLNVDVTHAAWQGLGQDTTSGGF
jgi:hypothetical protein